MPSSRSLPPDECCRGTRPSHAANCRPLPRLSIKEVAHYIKRSAVVIGTDTGFVHLASALGVPTAMVFTATARRQFGVNVPGVSLSVGDNGQPPSIDEVPNAVQIVMRKRELL
jgi:heptosyltransferase-1